MEGETLYLMDCSFLGEENDFEKIDLFWFVQIWSDLFANLY